MVSMPTAIDWLLRLNWASPVFMLVTFNFVEVFAVEWLRRFLVSPPPELRLLSLSKYRRVASPFLSLNGREKITEK